jgi:hypothetical protein
MASPSPISTPIAPTVVMGSSTPYMPEEALTPMQIDALRQRQALRRDEYAACGLAISEPQPASLSHGGNTAQRSRPGPLEAEDGGKFFFGILVLHRVAEA